MGAECGRIGISVATWAIVIEASLSHSVGIVGAPRLLVLICHVGSYLHSQVAGASTCLLTLTLSHSHSPAGTTTSSKGCPIHISLQCPIILSIQVCQYWLLTGSLLLLLVCHYSLQSCHNRTLPFGQPGGPGLSQREKRPEAGLLIRRSGRTHMPGTWT